MPQDDSFHEVDIAGASISGAMWLLARLGLKLRRLLLDMDAAGGDLKTSARDARARRKGFGTWFLGDELHLEAGRECEFIELRNAASLAEAWNS